MATSRAKTKKRLTVQGAVNTAIVSVLGTVKSPLTKVSSRNRADRLVLALDDGSYIICEGSDMTVRRSRYAR